MSTSWTAFVVIAMFLCLTVFLMWMAWLADRAHERAEARLDQRFAEHTNVLPVWESTTEIKEEEEPDDQEPQ